MAVSINHLTSNVTLQVTQPYLVVDDEGLKAFAVGVQGPPTGATVALAGLTDVDDAAVPTNRYFVVGDGTKFVTRGILGDDLPSGVDATKLANGLVSNAEFQYLDGVTSSIQTQIDGKAATSHVHSGADITTGTLGVARLNGGTTAQFVRGDGTYSNTLTGGLALGGHIVGSATGIAISPSSTLGADNAYAAIFGGPGNDIARGGAVLARGLNASNPGGVDIYCSTTAGNARVYSPNQTKYLLVNNSGVSIVGGSTAAFSGAVSTGALSSTTGAFSGAVTLSSACKIIHGSSGTTTAANNETTGTSTGPVTNAPSGSSVQLAIAGSINSRFGYCLGAVGANLFSLGRLGATASIDYTAPGICCDASLVRYNTTSVGQHLWLMGGASSGILSLGNALSTANSNAWAIGGYGIGLVGSTAGIACAGSGSIVSNVNSGGTWEQRVNGTARRIQAHIGGVTIADLGAPVVLANSTTTAIMTATNRHGRLEIFDNTGQWATVRISNAATPVLEAGSANFAITASPTASQLGINLSAGSLQIITGSAAGTTISVNFRGM